MSEGRADRRGAAGAMMALGIDIGTSGIRAVALDAAGVERASAAHRFPEGARADPREWRSGLRAALQALPRTDLIGAVAIDGTSGSLLAIDAAGQPMGPPIMYDERVEDRDLVERLDRAAPDDAVARGAGSGAAKAVVLARRPGAERIVHQADWLAGLLTGVHTASDENNALKTGYDPVARRWPVWLSEADVPVDMLPLVRPVGTVVGVVADGWPIAAGTPVVTGTTDGCASFLATGAAEPGEGVTALGSTLVLKMLSDRPVSAPRYGVYSHRVGDAWLVGGASNTGGAVLAAHYSAGEIEELSRTIDPARTPLPQPAYPLLRPGERFPINDSGHEPVMPAGERGAEHLLALLDGIAHVEAHGYRLLQELGAPPLARVLTVGGGAANEVWSEIRARHLGVPVERAASTEAASGTARIALAHLLGTPVGALSMPAEGASG